MALADNIRVKMAVSGLDTIMASLKVNIAANDKAAALKDVEKLAAASVQAGAAIATAA